MLEQVQLPWFQGKNDCESFSFGNGVVRLSAGQLSASIGNRISMPSTVTFLFQDCCYGYITCISVYTKRFERTRKGLRKVVRQEHKARMISENQTHPVVFDSKGTEHDERLLHPEVELSLQSVEKTSGNNLRTQENLSYRLRNGPFLYCCELLWVRSNGVATDKVTQVEDFSGSKNALSWFAEKLISLENFHDLSYMF